MLKFPIPCVGCLILALAIGCGGDPNRPELAEVTGIVSLDGQPVPDATVRFIPDSGRPSSGKTGASGEYSLQYLVDASGAVLGKHRVEISTEDLIENEETGERTIVPEKFPSIYNTESTLTFVVKSGSNEAKFELVQ